MLAVSVPDSPVLEPPAHLADADVLDLVRFAWAPAVNAIEHLPPGFGAHHRRASTDGAARWFVILASAGDRQEARSQEAPAERDLRVLTDPGHGDLVHADPAILEMFEREWRLDEIGQYAIWFEGQPGAHTG